MKLLIKNGRIMDPKSGMDQVSDILIEEGIIQEIKQGIETEAEVVLDAQGKVVAPGFVDVHVHLREPGFSHKETIKTGTQAAAAGGVTTVACMPNTKPAIHNAEVVKWIHEKSAAEGCVNVEVVGAITQGIAGETLAEIQDMIKQRIIAISDDGKTTMSRDLMKEAMTLIKDTELPLISHAEDHNLSEGGCMHLGEQSKKLGLPGIPAEAEYSIVARDIELAEETGAKLHIAHVSTEESLTYVKRAKEKGLKVTCEVGPHHFLLNETIVSHDKTETKVNPPIRDEAHRKAMIQGIKEGVIDIIATDHAPHDPASKSQPFEKAAFGISGIETMFSLCYTELVINQGISLMRLLEMMTNKPAEIIHIDKGYIAKGKAADLVILDLESSYTIDTNNFKSMGKNSPFNGYKVVSKIDATIVKGKIVYQGGQIQC